MESSDSYISFVLAGESPSHKTEIWRVVSNKSQATLGEIKWYGAWRRYAFFPRNSTIFDVDCMSQISTKIGELMIKQRQRLHDREIMDGMTGH